MSRYNKVMTQLGPVASGDTTLTATATEINTVADGTTADADEINVLAGVTAGTVAASKAVVVDANKDVTGFRAITATSTITGGGASLTGTVRLGTATSHLVGFHNGTGITQRAGSAQATTIVSATSTDLNSDMCNYLVEIGNTLIQYGMWKGSA